MKPESPATMDDDSETTTRQDSPVFGRVEPDNAARKHTPVSEVEPKTTRQSTPEVIKAENTTRQATPDNNNTTQTPAESHEIDGNLCSHQIVTKICFYLFCYLLITYGISLKIKTEKQFYVQCT